MKKNLICVLAVLLILALALCGCGSKSKDNGKTGDKENGSSATASKSITLEFDMGTEEGFDWNAHVGDEKILKVEKGEVKGTKISFTITAKAAGKTDVNFLYKRPTDVDISLVAKYTYTVDKDLKITENDKTGTYFNK